MTGTTVIQGDLGFSVFLSLLTVSDLVLCDGRGLQGRKDTSRWAWSHNTMCMLTNHFLEYYRNEHLKGLIPLQ